MIQLFYAGRKTAHLGREIILQNAWDKAQGSTAELSPEEFREIVLAALPGADLISKTFAPAGRCFLAPQRRPFQFRGARHPRLPLLFKPAASMLFQLL